LWIDKDPASEAHIGFHPQAALAIVKRFVGWPGGDAVHFDADFGKCEDQFRLVKVFRCGWRDRSSSSSS
jgi:hypothetical protein